MVVAELPSIKAYSIPILRNFFEWISRFPIDSDVKKPTNVLLESGHSNKQDKRCDIHYCI